MVRAPPFPDPGVVTIWIDRNRLGRLARTVRSARAVVRLLEAPARQSLPRTVVIDGAPGGRLDHAPLKGVATSAPQSPERSIRLAAPGCGWKQSPAPQQGRCMRPSGSPSRAGTAVLLSLTTQLQGDADVQVQCVETGSHGLDRGLFSMCDTVAQSHGRWPCKGAATGAPTGFPPSGRASGSSGSAVTAFPTASRIPSAPRTIC